MTKVIVQAKFAKSPVADFVTSDVYQTEGLDCWTAFQDSSHGALHSSSPSEIRFIPGAVGKWTAELCICLSQVCNTLLQDKYHCWPPNSQVCCPRLRPRSSTQSFQIAIVRG